jgi:NAD(P)-dependent dehydrogenase (short-subunit alcohol dehydrogenase family)
MDLLTKGLIKPIRAKTIFPASQIQDAFRFMQKGQHIGKIIVTMPENSETDLPVTPDVPQLVLRPDASYLLVGGLGGIGRAVAVWMAMHGATNLIFLSRSAGKKESDQALFRELREMGCSVQAYAGSVSCKHDTENVVSMAARPIAGVIQMSMVLQDRALPEMTYDNFLAAVEPKVQGTWTLHNALCATPLSFFVVFSSTSGMAGWTGQANYAAANTFLDAFVQYRHSLGLPASVLVVGTVEDVGYVSEKPAVLEMFRARAIHTLREQDLLESLHLAIARSGPYSHPPTSTISAGLGGNYVNASQLAIGIRSTIPFSSPDNRAHWKRDIRLAIARNYESTIPSTTDSSTNEALRAFLSTAPTNPTLLNQDSSTAFLTQQIGTRLYSFMLLPEEELDVTKPLSAIGVDSLVAIEIRNWWRQNLGFEVSVLEILNAGSLEHLGKLAVEGLRVKFAEADVVPEPDRTIHEQAKAL